MSFRNDALRSRHEPFVDPATGRRREGRGNCWSPRNIDGVSAQLRELISPSDPFDLGHPTIWINKLRFAPTSSAATDYRLEVDVE